jgi:integrase
MARKRSNGEGSFYRRKGDGRWVAAISITDPLTGESKRHAFYGKTLKEAKAKQLQALQAAEQGLTVVESGSSVQRFLEVWIRDHLPVSGRKESTIRQYARLLSIYVQPHLGQKKLTSLTPLVIEAWIKNLRSKGLSETTIRAAFNVLSLVLDTAVRDGLLRTNPCSKVARPQPDTEEAKYLTVDQIQSVIQQAQGSLKPLLTLMALTGLRIGEILALHWDDLDLERGALTVNGTLVPGTNGLIIQKPKTKRSQRTIPLVEVAVQALREQKRIQNQERLKAGPLWQDHGLIFPTSIGTPEHYRNILRTYQKIAKPYGIGKGFHTLRHSAGTLLSSLGIPVATVSAILGHSRTSITHDIYTHALPEDSRRAVEELSKLIGS